ncbi:molybdenum cofactor biosynthesis protein MoaE [Demequina capsici]|uniref:Molybdenum cofactor biosynthesis protein MoaE n=1 Tax=Demequina capsici TaxID=3075620 RepID=A0AA96JB68_9MICO|nr:molybdenum cofactor biosynthesis protein MoaE [Demequina sp. OYTSA14]WNM25456.1 molybdenum cofactor biosynthesis protein MoaE [Demequina sp. OYTSA14]
MSVALIGLSATALDVSAHIAAVSGPPQGAIATFLGTVRDHDPSVVGEVTHLDYSAHPDAGAVLAHIAGTVADAHPGTTLAVTHRVGLLAVGEAAIVAAASSAHRAEAFDACRDLVERVKAELPVWKREILADGSHTWVGL